jgi:HK97 family phage major capsid protein
MERVADLTRALAPVGATPRAVDFGRFIQARIRGAEDGIEAAEDFARAIGASSRVVEALRKSAIAAGTTTTSAWGGALVTANTLASEFVALERSQTVLGRLGVRRVPFNTAFHRVDVASVAGWVAQGAPVPVSSADLSTVTLPLTKLGGISVITRELAAHSNPAAAVAIAADLAASAAAFQDAQLLDPDAIAGDGPASITSALTAITSSGATLTNIVTDLKLAMGQIVASGHPLGRAVWVTSEKSAAYIATLQVTGGAFAFPTLGANGGILFGLPVITSGACERPGSPSENFIVLLDPQSVAVADDGGVEIDISREATVEMSDTPTAGGASHVSLFQTGSIAIKVVRYVNWVRRQATGIAIIRGVTY